LAKAFSKSQKSQVKNGQFVLLRYCDGNSDGLKSGRRNAISSPVLECKIRKD